jgi:hypothetical protein
MRQISETLDLLLEDDQPEMDWNLFRSSTTVCAELETAKAHVHQLLFELQKIRQKMCNDLAYRIRRLNPSYNISVDKNGCKIGYRKKSLYIRPDLQRGLWQVSSKDDGFAAAFRRQNKSSIYLTPDIEGFVKNVDHFFRAHYKTLHESIVGEGIILIDGHTGKLSDLAERRKNG